MTAAMVLAAGRGERMRPVTDRLPKPLVRVGGAALIDHVLDGLAAAGVTRAVVNLWYLADLIAAHLAGRTAPAITLSLEAALLDTGRPIIVAPPEAPATSAPVEPAADRDSKRGF